MEGMCVCEHLQMYATEMEEAMKVVRGKKLTKYLHK